MYCSLVSKILVVTVMRARVKSSKISSDSDQEDDAAVAVMVMRRRKEIKEGGERHVQFAGRMLEPGMRDEEQKRRKKVKRGWWEGEF